MAWIFFFVSILAIAWLGFLVRRRRREHKESEQAREMAFLLAHGELPGGALAGDNVLKRQASDGESLQGAAPQPTPSVTPVAVPAGARPAYLDVVRATAYRRLRAALPSHEVFPRASLRRAAGLESIEKDALLDFVVCTSALVPVAAVDLVRGERASPADAIKRETLERAGVRYARWRHDALPDSETIATWLTN
ncbi:MAG: DUF2726 domain-containing protein [Zoogloeaceae bacterium]|uniref:DUF2726 domain-containing protein n=1 Tax=Denitromonas sp. TaxID=2734609 RepID=UPI001D2439C5|nr:DUF2726 domain-containing protein [Rhodocyclaceae bacterium]MCP5220124.1 DUF2726 domain-containing protein [Zoogloeaceae bacterium]